MPQLAHRRALLAGLGSPRWRSPFVTEVPKPLFLLACGDVDINLPRIGWLETLRSMSDLSSLSFKELVDSQYRSVTLGRLERVLNAGIDVEPPTAVFSTDSWDKALEYGQHHDHAQSQRP